MYPVFFANIYNPALYHGMVWQILTAISEKGKKNNTPNIYFISYQLSRHSKHNYKIFCHNQMFIKNIPYKNMPKHI